MLFLPVHTPDRAERFDGDKKLSVGLDQIPVLVDNHGELCDRFGFRRKTTNVIIDRRGVVSAVGGGQVEGMEGAAAGRLRRRVPSN